MNEQIGKLRFQVTLVGQVYRWLEELETVELLTKKIREKHPEAEIVVELRVE